jgi:hypothetical protein
MKKRSTAWKIYIARSSADTKSGIYDNGFAYITTPAGQIATALEDMITLY